MSLENHRYLALAIGIVILVVSISAFGVAANEITKTGQLTTEKTVITVSQVPEGEQENGEITPYAQLSQDQQEDFKRLIPQNTRVDPMETDLQPGTLVSLDSDVYRVSASVVPVATNQFSRLVSFGLWAVVSLLIIIFDIGFLFGEALRLTTPPGSSPSPVIYLIVAAPIAAVVALILLTVLTPVGGIVLVAGLVALIFVLIIASYGFKLSQL